MSKQPITFTTRKCLSKTVKSLVDCRGLTPDALQDLSIDAIKNCTLLLNNTRVKVSDVFDVTGEDSQHIVFNHHESHIQLDCVGAWMRVGKITFYGDAGDYCGLNMISGEIVVHGNTQDLTACNMVNGFITIHGNAGDFVGGGLDGARQGIKNGIILIKGNAGARVGDQMRRGLILIEGNTGDYCGSRMIAGTIGVLGNVGKYTGFNMRRGTILLQKPFTPHPTIQDCGAHTLPFLSLLYTSFSKFDTPFSILHNQRVRRYIGDLSHNGNGEILQMLG
jgi:formylmethanofuran dehydrogenase subunit C